MPRRAYLGAVLALLGMAAACTTTPPLTGHPDDPHIDAVWAALQRGDLDGAYRAREAMEDRAVRRRAELDLLAARRGRSEALHEALEQGPEWMAARFDASALRAERRLAAHLDTAPDDGLALVERARRTPQAGVSLARAADAGREGGHKVEAALITFESLLASGRLVEAGEVLDRLEALDGAAAPPSARVAIARRRWDATTGKLVATVDGLLDDVEQGLAVPASLALLESVLTSMPLPERAARARRLLAEPRPGAHMERVRRRLVARLDAAAGDLLRAREGLAGLGLLLPAEDALRRRWDVQLGRRAPHDPEERLDADPDRTASPELFARRVTHAWNLAARETYVEAVEQGEVLDLDAFTARLDAAAAVVPGRPSLAALPRHDYGFFGQLLDTAPLREHLPGTMVLGGKGLGLPSDIACFDIESTRQVELADGLGTYEQLQVRRPQVLGFVASRGGRIAGAGIDRTVYLDLDQVELSARGRQLVEEPLASAAAGEGAAARSDEPLDDPLAEGSRDLHEPLDVARRLRAAVWADEAARIGASVLSADERERLLLEVLAEHEEQHIVDFREFMGRGTGGKLLSVLGAGLLPGAVRAEIERRAQLRALRRSSDPRLALAQCVDVLPVEGPAWSSEHAVGYSRLLEQLLAALETGRWEGARPLEELGLDGSRPLVQQLHRLDAETVRALAHAVPD